MITLSTEPLHQFIADHQLKRVDGNIIFDAKVNFNSGNTLQSINSQVQLIVLTNEIAVYILEFLKEEYNITEMYNTGQYHFGCTEAKTLEISKRNEHNKFLISIIPIQ
jgi:hypothetical protein